MGRYIDADKLLEKRFIFDKDGELIGKRSYVSEFDIDTAHHIDIVRCVECRYKDMDLCPMHILVVAGVRKPYDFCSYGERQESN